MLRRQERGIVRLLSRPGAGRTTALAHLAAELGPTSPLPLPEGPPFAIHPHPPPRRWPPPRPRPPRRRARPNFPPPRARRPPLRYRPRTLPLARRPRAQR